MAFEFIALISLLAKLQMANDPVDGLEKKQRVQ